MPNPAPQNNHPIDRAWRAVQACQSALDGVPCPREREAERVFDFLELGGAYGLAHVVLCKGRRASRVSALGVLSRMALALRNGREPGAGAMLALIERQQRDLFQGDPELWA